MGIAKYEIFGTEGTWRVLHDGKAENDTPRRKQPSRPQSRRRHSRSARAMRGPSRRPPAKQPPERPRISPVKPRAFRPLGLVPRASAKAATAANPAPHAQVRTTFYGLRRRQAWTERRSGHAQDNPCDRQHRSRDDIHRAFASMHPAKPLREWRRQRCWQIWRLPC